MLIKNRTSKPRREHALRKHGPCCLLGCTGNGRLPLVGAASFFGQGLLCERNPRKNNAILVSIEKLYISIHQILLECTSLLVWMHDLQYGWIDTGHWLRMYMD